MVADSDETDSDDSQACPHAGPGKYEGEAIPCLTRAFDGPEAFPVWEDSLPHGGPWVGAWDSEGVREVIEEAQLCSGCQARINERTAWPKEGFLGAILHLSETGFRSLTLFDSEEEEAWAHDRDLIRKGDSWGQKEARQEASDSEGPHSYPG